MLQLFPSAGVFHLGLYRDKTSFTPTEYYSKLPLEFEKHCDIVYLLDPVVATGGTSLAAVGMLQGKPSAGVHHSKLSLRESVADEIAGNAHCVMPCHAMPCLTFPFPTVLCAPSS